MSKEAVLVTLHWEVWEGLFQVRCMVRKSREAQTERFKQSEQVQRPWSGNECSVLENRREASVIGEGAGRDCG